MVSSTSLLSFSNCRTNLGADLNASLYLNSEPDSDTDSETDSDTDSDSDSGSDSDMASPTSEASDDEDYECCFLDAIKSGPVEMACFGNEQTSASEVKVLEVDEHD
jgi:hypothetical protein